MPQLDQFQPICEMTKKAKFDMCMFGLKHPISKRFLRKSSQVFSTNGKLIDQLCALKCDDRHLDQQIEGSVAIGGERMSLTRFCATYCSGFANKLHDV